MISSKTPPNILSEEVNFLKLLTNFINKIEFTELSKTIDKKSTKSDANKKNFTLNSTTHSKKSKTPVVTTNEPHTFLEYEVTNQQEFLTNEEKQVEFFLQFTPNKKGLFKASIAFEVIEGIPISLDVRANIIGPRVRISSPTLDFGLMSVEDVKSVSFKVTNSSPVPINVLIKDAAFKNISFKNYKENHYLEEVEGNLKEPIPKEKIKNILDFENWDNEFLNLAKDYKYLLKFSTAYFSLQPSQEVEVNVSFASPTKN